MGTWREWSIRSWRNKVSCLLSPFHHPLRSFYLSLSLSCSVHSTPVLVDTLSGKNVVCVIAGGEHSVAVTEDGAIYTWGMGSYGRLGHGEARRQYRYERVNPSLSGHLLIKDTSLNRTLTSVSNATFVYLTIPKLRTPHYSGHFNLTQ